jgi:hypothetical protein
MSEYIFANRGENTASIWSVRRRTAAQRIVPHARAARATVPPARRRAIRCVKITRQMPAHKLSVGDVYGRFMGGFGRGSCHHRHCGHTVRGMRILQMPDHTSICDISLISRMGS